ncbi:GNAT family N-acetyltransferase, partial [Nereida sp.]|uniref:GNAT family N-acetyltransferase n=1 Tax=Nereida sp. TaxID=2736090 RepID=UPI003F69B150
MNKAPEIEVRIVSQIAEIGQAEWDACVTSDHKHPDDPFTTYRFLKALEDSGSVGTGTGWQPHYLHALEGGETIGVAPMFGKSHSQGEYIFDHNWAHAYERAGGRYYPKLQIAVPHTPATGRRFLVKDGREEVARSALMQRAVQVAGSNNFSSLHITFCTDDERAFGAELGLLERSSQQFHWLNNGYADFDGFLSSLSSRKRKNIRKEREKAQSFGGEIHCLTGDQIQPEHWNAFWVFYQDTGARKWGTPYLTRAFFDHAQQHLRDDMLLILAER